MIHEKLLDIFRAILFKNSFDLSIFELSLERKVFQDIVELKYPIIIFTVQTKRTPEVLSERFPRHGSSQSILTWPSDDPGGWELGSTQGKPSKAVPGESKRSPSKPGTPSPPDSPPEQRLQRS